VAELETGAEAERAGGPDAPAPEAPSATAPSAPGPSLAAPGADAADADADADADDDPITRARQPLRRRGYQPVHLFGRAWPRATLPERLVWAVLLVACSAVLVTATRLQPDGRGVGTHEQLGLPPCGFVAAFDAPCPSCGFTTTFTLAAHGRPVDAIVNQPFGFLVFLATVAAVPLALASVFKGVSLLEVVERWPLGRVILATFALWIVSWIYKWQVLGI